MPIQITLKDIKVNSRLSEETNNYSATLFVDGRKVGEVGNDGGGGCDRVLSMAPGVTRADFVEFDRRCKTELPAETFQGITLDMSLDLVCGKIVEQHLNEKLVGRELKSKVFFVEGGKLRGYKLPKGRLMTDLLAHVKKNHKDCPILNEMPISEATRLYLESPEPA
jgi:hypothetical protein